jgi:thioredoxin reductase
LKNKYKYIIIGAGPAGLQMAYFLQKLKADYLVIEKNAKPGAFYAKFPIHRKLISINKKYNYFTEKEFNLRHDWNSLLNDDPELSFTRYSDELFPSADDLFKYLNDFSDKWNLNIRYNTTVNQISKNINGDFKVQLESGSLACEVLLLGTGVVKQYIPEEIDGIEHATAYGDINLDFDLYKNKRVGILGGGNSAFETADSLSNTAAFVHVFLKSKLKLAYETHFVGNLRAKYTSIFDLYQLKSLHAVLKPRVKVIEKLNNGTLRTQHEYDYADSNVPGTLKLTREYDYIFNCTGFIYTHDNLFHEEIKPASILEGKFYDLNSNWESKNIKNLFIIGTGMQAIDRKASSGFIHGFRYNIQTLASLLQESYEGKEYPSDKVLVQPFESFLKKLYTRFSIGDGIFQLYGFLGDVLEYDPKEKSVLWKKELPVEYATSKIDPSKKTLILTLEFGFEHYPNQSSLDFMGPSDPHNTDKSAFLHPIIRYYYKNELKEFHFGDSLLGRWDMPHSEGGAIASYHSEFYNWLADIFSLEKIDVSDMGENPNFEKW